jgi:HPt (histidine-containing phosphotransfer) domain-containing protein
MNTPEYLQIPSNLKPLDEEHLEMLASVDDDGSSNLIKSLVETFVRDNECRFDSITDACTQQDMDALRKHTHFICGSTANLGLCRVSALCRQVEKSILDGQFSSFEAFPDQLKTEYREGMNHLKMKIGLN